MNFKTASTIKKYLTFILAFFVMLPVLSKTLEDVAPEKTLNALVFSLIVLGIVVIVLWGR